MDTTALPDKAAFAKANGLDYEPGASAAGASEPGASAPRAFDGALFDYLQDAVVTDRFVSDRFEVGAIAGTVGGSQQQKAANGWTITTSYETTRRAEYGYLALQLDRKLPQFVLDAKSNGRSIPMPMAGGQRVSLEGDFDSHFQLYAPHGRETDALYVFTPDLMALLIDETNDLDVEIVDDWFFVYSPKPFDLADPAVWERLDQIRTVVGAKAISQTERFSDSTAGGVRLQQGFLGGRAANGGIRWMVNGGPGVLVAVIVGMVVAIAVAIGIIVTVSTSLFGVF